MINVDHGWKYVHGSVVSLPAVKCLPALILFSHILGLPSMLCPRGNSKQVDLYLLHFELFFLSLKYSEELDEDLDCDVPDHKDASKLFRAKWTSEEVSTLKSVYLKCTHLRLQNE